MNIEELQEKFEQLASGMDWIKTKLIELQEEKGLAPVKTPYEVEVPEDLENYFYVDETGIIYKLSVYVASEQIKILNRGLAFKTKEEAEQFDKERILINKFKDWAKKYNEGWTPNWVESEDKFYIDYHYGSKCFQVKDAWHANAFHKLPYLKSQEIALQFIEEFVEEINEVLY